TSKKDSNTESKPPVPSAWDRFYATLKQVGFHDWVTLAATVAIAIATTVYTSATIVYTSYSGKQWKAMIESNQIAKTSAEAAKSAADTAHQALTRSHRPWVFVSSDIVASDPLTFDPSTAHADIDYTLKNVGASPALHEWDSVDIIV